MSFASPGFALMFSLGCIGSVLAAPAPIATWMPADTCFYIEIVEPRSLGQQFEKLLPNSHWSSKQSYAQESLEQAGLQLRPSLLVMAKRLLRHDLLPQLGTSDAIALAITNFHGTYGTDFVFVVRFKGERIHLVPEKPKRGKEVPEPKVLAMVEGINLREVPINENIVYGLPDMEINRQGDQPSGPPPLVIADANDFLVVGTHVQLVKDVIRRAKGKELSPAFSSISLYERGSEFRQNPGIYFQGKPQLLVSQLEPHLLRWRPVHPISWVAFKNLLPPGAMEEIAGQIAIKDGGVSLSTQAYLPDQSKSPLLEVLAGASLREQGIGVEPSSAGLRVSIPFAPGPNKPERIIRFLDGIAKATGTLGPLPKEIFEEMIAKKCPVSTILAGVSGIECTVAGTGSKSWMPTILVRMDTVEAALLAEKWLPDLVEILGGNFTTPTRQTLAGVRLSSITGEDSPTGETLHIARTENRFAFGPETKFIVDRLRKKEAADPIQSNQVPRVTSAASVEIRWQPFLETLDPTLQDQSPATTDRTTPRSILRRYDGRRSPVSPIVSWLSVVFPHMCNLPPVVATMQVNRSGLRLEMYQPAPTGGFTALWEAIASLCKPG